MFLLCYFSTLTNYLLARSLQYIQVESFLEGEEETRISPLQKEASRHLFNFGVIPQVLSTQLTTIVNNRFRRSQSVDNS